MGQNDADDGPTPAEALADVKRLAAKRKQGCYWHARRYLHSYRRWNAVALTLTVVSATASVLAGAALLTQYKDEPAIAVTLGVLGIVAGLAQAFDRALGAAKRADDFRKGEVEYDRMRARYHAFIETHTDSATAMDAYRILRQADEGLPASLPRPVEKWTHKRVVKEGAPG